VETAKPNSQLLYLNILPSKECTQVKDPVECKRYSWYREKDKSK